MRNSVKEAPQEAADGVAATAPDYPASEFADLYARLTLRFKPAAVPKQVCRRVLAISQVVLAFQHLQDTLQRLNGIFQSQAAIVPAPAPQTEASIEYLLLRLEALAKTAAAGWQTDLKVLLDRAQAAREVFDLLLCARAASPRSLALLGMPASMAAAQTVEQFAEEVERLDAAFFALGAGHVLDCHERGVALDGTPLARGVYLKPRRRGKREARISAEGRPGPGRRLASS